MAFEDFKDLLRRTVFDNVLNDKPFDIAKSLKHDGYQLGIVSMVDFFFLIKSLLLVLLIVKLF